MTTVPPALHDVRDVQTVRAAVDALLAAREQLARAHELVDVLVDLTFLRVATDITQSATHIDDALWWLERELGRGEAVLAGLPEPEPPDLRQPISDDAAWDEEGDDGCYVDPDEDLPPGPSEPDDEDDLPF